MTAKKLILLFISVLFIFTFVVETGFAQVQTPKEGGASSPQQMQKITVKGKIAYMKNLGGYYVNGEDPPGEYMVVNMNTKVLKKLMKSGKTVTIEGHLTIGADHLFIEKIDGKKYIGKQ